MWPPIYLFGLCTQHEIYNWICAESNDHHSSTELNSPPIEKGIHHHRNNGRCTNTIIWDHTTYFTFALFPLAIYSRGRRHCYCTHIHTNALQLVSRRGRIILANFHYFHATTTIKTRGSSTRFLFSVSSTVLLLPNEFFLRIRPLFLFTSLAWSPSNSFPVTNINNNNLCPFSSIPHNQRGARGVRMI